MICKSFYKQKSMIAVAVMGMLLLFMVACNPDETQRPDSAAKSVSESRPAVASESQTEKEESGVSIVDAKTAWEDRLMAIPGVTGVAVGLSSKGKEKIIKVYVSKSGTVARDQIPGRIEGYPVEIETRGDFKVY